MCQESAFSHIEYGTRAECQHFHAWSMGDLRSLCTSARKYGKHVQCLYLHWESLRSAMSVRSFAQGVGEACGESLFFVHIKFGKCMVSLHFQTYGAGDGLRALFLCECAERLHFDSAETRRASAFSHGMNAFSVIGLESAWVVYIFAYTVRTSMEITWSVCSFTYKIWTTHGVSTLLHRK